MITWQSSWAEDLLFSDNLYIWFIEKLAEYYDSECIAIYKRMLRFWPVSVSHCTMLWNVCNTNTASDKYTSGKDVSLCRIKTFHWFRWMSTVSLVLTPRDVV